MRCLAAILSVILIPIIFALPALAADTITIVACQYGTLGDKRPHKYPRGEKSCLAELADACNGRKSCPFVVDNPTMGGDPAPHHHKRVSIDHRCGSGKIRPINVDERSFVRISC